MANPSKKKGTRAETNVVKALQAMGYQAERKALKGNKDEGDVRLIVGPIEFVVEVKAGKQTSNPNRSTLLNWIAQADAEAYNSGLEGNWFLIVSRYNRSINDADVYYRNKEHLCFCWLSDLPSTIDKLIDPD